MTDQERSAGSRLAARVLFMEAHRAERQALQSSRSACASAHAQHVSVTALCTRRWCRAGLAGGQAAQESEDRLALKSHASLFRRDAETPEHWRAAPATSRPRARLSLPRVRSLLSARGLKRGHCRRDSSLRVPRAPAGAPRRSRSEVCLRLRTSHDPHGMRSASPNRGGVRETPSHNRRAAPTTAHACRTLPLATLRSESGRRDEHWCADPKAIGRTPPKESPPLLGPRS